MSDAPAPIGSRIAAALWRTPWLYGWMVACAVLVPILSFRKQSELMGCYLPASHRMLEAQSLPGPEWWVYPPAFTAPVLPLAMLPVPLARVLWCVMLVTSAVLAVRAIWNALMLDARFRAAVQVPWKFFLFGGLLALSSVGHTIVPLGYQAHDVVVFMLVALGAWCSACAAVGHGQIARCERQAGVTFGLAASFKVMPVLFLPVLAAQRRWRACVAMAITGVVVAIGFDLVAWLFTGQTHFIAWLRLAAQGGDLTASGGGRWAPWNPLNQSGTGILTRLMVPTPTDRGLDYECMLVAVGDGGRRIVLAVWILAMTSTLLWFCWGTARRIATRVSASCESASLWAIASVGATACTYVLIAPHSSNYHFAPVAIAAAAMLGWMLTRGLDAWMVICIGVMILIELIPGRDVIGGRLADIKLAYGSVGICAFMAMLGALRVMVRASRSAA